MMKLDPSARTSTGQENGAEARTALLQSCPTSEEPHPTRYTTGGSDVDEEELTDEIDRQWTELRTAVTNTEVSWTTFSDKVGRLIKTLYKLRYFTR